MFDAVLSAAYQRSDQLQNYWSFYSTVVLGIVAFFASMKAERRTVMLAAFVSLAFLAVSVANLQALVDVSRQRLALQDRLVHLAASDAGLLPLVRTITPSSVFAVSTFHLVFDAFTLVAVWTLVLKAGGDGLARHERTLRRG